MGPRQHKGLFSATATAASTAGIAVGVAVVLVVTGACTPSQLQRWGWRVPFLLSAVTAGAALLLRLHMTEPEEFTAAKEAAEREEATRASEEGGAKVTSCWARFKALPFCQMLHDSWARLLLQFLFVTGAAVCFWLSTAYLPGFFQKVGVGW